LRRKNGLREVKILVLTQGIIINEDGLLRYFLMTKGKWFILPYQTMVFFFQMPKCKPKSIKFPE
jgi:hypothetical protein